MKHEKPRENKRLKANEAPAEQSVKEPETSSEESGQTPKEKREKPKRKITGRAVVGVAIALALVFVIFLFITTNFLSNNMLVTETAYHSVAYDVIKTTALIVRDEEYIPTSSGGVLMYSVSDGDKIPAGGVIATAYKNESDVVKTLRIREIDEKISYLESLNSITRSTNIALDTVNSQLREKFIALLSNINTRSFDSITQAEEELMTSIYRKQVLTGQQGSFDSRIAQLQEEKASLAASVGAPVATVTSPKDSGSGYFVSSVDGYEHCVDLDSLSRLRYEDYEKIAPEKLSSGTYIGKVIHGVDWYMICPVTADQATNISHGSSTVSVRIPYALTEEIPAKVLHVSPASADGNAVVVLKCTYMNEVLSKIRSEAVEIVINSFEGLKISKSAIHDGELTRTVTDDKGNRREETKTVQGVYVEYGNELRFRQIVIAYAGEDYVICKENPDPDLLFTGETISLYDKVVTEGGDLYDGKLFQ